MENFVVLWFFLVFLGHAENGEKLGMDFCRSATTRNLAYKIYKVGIFPKSVAGKCPTKFNEAEYGRNFS